MASSSASEQPSAERRHLRVGIHALGVRDQAAQVGRVVFGADARQLRPVRSPVAADDVAAHAIPCVDVGSGLRRAIHGRVRAPRQLADVGDERGDLPFAAAARRLAQTRQRSSRDPRRAPAIHSGVRVTVRSASGSHGAGVPMTARAVRSARDHSAADLAQRPAVVRVGRTVPPAERREHAEADQRGREPADDQRATARIPLAAAVQPRQHRQQRPRPAPAARSRRPPPIGPEST